ncbi:MAG: hypothetical protein AAFN81_05380 [Bacteroidota bacterium]
MMFRLTFLFCFVFSLGCMTDDDTMVPDDQPIAQLPDLNQLQIWTEGFCATPHRIIGTQEWLDGVNYVEQQFAEMGFENIIRDEFPINVWEADDWSLTVNGQNFPCYYEFGTGFTDLSGVSGELTYIGDDLNPNEPVANKIVLVDMPFGLTNGEVNPFLRPNHLGNPEDELISLLDVYWQIKDRFAKGVVFILSNSLTCNPEYTYPRSNDDEWPIPSLFVGKDVGEELKALADSGNEANITLTGSRTPGTGINIWVELAGSSDDKYIISTHGDAPFKGVIEDGTGVVSVLAQASYWKDVPEADRPNDMIFLVTASHFYNSDGGSRLFRQQHPDIVDDTKLLMVLEHLGAKQYTFSNCELVTEEEPMDWLIYHSEGDVETELNNLENSYLPVDGLRTVATNTFPLSAALGFVFDDADNPLPKPENYVSVLTAPWYLITSEDTFDKVDYQELLEANEAVLEMTNNYMDEL